MICCLTKHLIDACLHMQISSYVQTVTSERTILSHTVYKYLYLFTFLLSSSLYIHWKRMNILKNSKQLISKRSRTRSSTESGLILPLVSRFKNKTIKRYKQKILLTLLNLSICIHIFHFLKNLLGLCQWYNLLSYFPPVMGALGSSVFIRMYSVPIYIILLIF